MERKKETFLIYETKRTKKENSMYISNYFALVGEQSGMGALTKEQGTCGLRALTILKNERSNVCIFENLFYFIICYRL